MSGADAAVYRGSGRSGATPASLRQSGGAHQRHRYPAHRQGVGPKITGCSVHWARLAKSPLPAIAATKTGGFFIVAKVAEDRALIHRVVVMRGGAVSAILDGESATEETIMAHAVWH
jgi:hypothetical protein